jgi:large subunit ribosomal protein L29
MKAKIDEIRALGNDRLGEEEFSTRLEILNLKFKIATRQLADASGLRTAKLRLAQILTVQKERELIGGAE